MIVVVHCNIQIQAEEDDLDKSNVVYCITFPNNKKYIGLTTLTLRERISAHCSNAFNVKLTKYKTKVYKAIRKYRTFTVSIVYLGDLLELLEMHFISLFDAFNNGYNLTTGGEHNKTIADEVRLKISNANKGRTVVNKGISMSEEQKQLVSRRCKEAFTNGRVHPLLKAVVLLDLNCNIIAEYPSMSKASETTGINFRYISKCCLGLRKSSGGFKWEYKRIE